MLRGIVAAVLIGAGLTAVPASGAATKSPITILWIGDTTGPAKAYGTVQLAGVRGAARYFNRHGGIAGHRVVVKAVSDNSDPTTAATELTQQLASSTPTMVWAGSNAIDSAAMIPLLARHRVFAITLVDGDAQCQTDATVKCPNEWSLANPTGIAQQGVVNWIKSRGLTNVGVVEETTPFAESENPNFLHAAAEAGLTVEVASFPPTAVDLTPQLEALQQGGAQVVYNEGVDTGKYAFTARANLGWNVPMIFDSGASALDLTKLTSATNIGNAFEDALYGENSRLADPGLGPMVAEAGRYADVTALPLTATGTGWDAVVTLDAAVTRAGGSLNVGRLDAAMLHIPASNPLRTLTRKLGWTKNDHENVLGTPDDYSVFPVGPAVNGRVGAP